MPGPAEPARDKDSEKKPASGSPAVGDLLRRTRRFLEELAGDYVKHFLAGPLRWVLGRALSYLLAAALFCIAATFLLWGGVQGLREAGVPPYLAYLALGCVAILAGLVILKLSGHEPRS